MRLFCLFASLWLYTIYVARSQTAQLPVTDPAPNDSLPSQVIQAITLYQKTAGEQSHLYNGWEYVEYDIHIKDHQFFDTDYPEDGTVHYDGVTYTQVPMLYDLVRDQLVIEHYNGADRIILISEKVQNFSFLNHTFVRLAATDSSRDNSIQTGFYDQLYNGGVKAYARRVKLIEEEIVQLTLNRFFAQKDHYFIWKDGVYYPVKSKRSVISLFEDHKKELGKVLRENKLRFRKDREAAIVKLVTRYDELRRR